MKKTPFQLTFNEQHSRYVCEVFGMPETLYDMLKQTMHDFFEGIKDYDNLPSTSKTETLAEYLASQTFRDLNWNPSTANEYFMLGYLFSGILTHLQNKQLGPLAPLLDMLTARRQGEGSDEEEVN